MRTPAVSCTWARATASMTERLTLAFAGGLLLGLPALAGAQAGSAEPAAPAGEEQILGGGVAIALPPGMALKPNPNLIRMKEVEQWDYRLRSAPVSIALSGMGFKVPKDAKPGPIDTRDIVTRASAQYLPQSTAAAAEPVAFGTGRLAGHHVTLRAKAGGAFAIGFDAPRRCVTTAVVAAGVYDGMAVSYSITIGSDDCDSEAHRAAVAAVAAMRPL